MDFNPAPSRWYKTEETVPHPKFSMLLRAIATTDPTSVYINSHGEQQYELFNMVRAGNMPTVELVDADGETAPFQAEAEGWDGSVPTFKSYAFTIRAVAKGLPEAVQKFGLEFTKDANGIWMFKVEPV
jgi:hypothetical protein